MSTLLVLLLTAALLGGWRKYSDRKEKLTRYLKAHEKPTALKKRVEEGL